MTTITTLILKLFNHSTFFVLGCIMVCYSCDDQTGKANETSNHLTTEENYEVIKSVNNYSYYNSQYTVTIKTVKNSNIYKVNMVRDSLLVFDAWIDSEQLRIATDSSKNKNIIKEYSRLANLPVQELASTGGGRLGYTYFKATFAPPNDKKVVLRFGINYLKDPGKIVVLGIYTLQNPIVDYEKESPTTDLKRNHENERTAFIQNFLGRYRFEKTSSAEPYSRVIKANRFYQINLKSTESFINKYSQKDYNEFRFDFYYYRNSDELKEVRKEIISNYGTGGMEITPETKGVKNPPQYYIFNDSTLIVGKMSCETMDMDSFWTWDHVKQAMREAFADSTSEIIGNDCASPFYWINNKEE